MLEIYSKFTKKFTKSLKNTVSPVARNITEHRIFYLIIILLIILRLPSFFEGYWYSDEGIYGSISYAMSRGQKLYLDVYDHKPQLMFYLYFVFGTAHKLFWAKFAATISALFTMIFIYKSVHNLVSKSAAIIASICTLVLLGTVVFEANIANAEIFFLPFVAGAFLLLTRSEDNFLRLGSLLFGIAFSIKIHPVFDYLAFAWLVIILAFESHGKVDKYYLYSIAKKAAKSFYYFCIPILVVFTWEFLFGDFSLFVRAAFIDAFSYTSDSYNSPIPAFFISLPFKTLITSVVVISISFLYLRKKISRPLFFAGVIFTVEIFAAFLSGRAYRHYLLQTVLGCSLLISIMFESKQTLVINVKKFLLVVLFVIVLGGYFFVGFRPVYTNDYSWPKVRDDVLFPITYYKAWAKAILGDTKVTDFAYDFGTDEPRLRQLKKALSVLVPENVYLYTDVGWSYYYVRQEPPYRIIVAYQLDYKDTSVRQDELIWVLERKNVKMIVLDKQKAVFAELNSLLEAQYFLVKSDQYFDYYAFID